MAEPVTLEEVKLNFDKLEQKLDNVSKQFSSIQRSLDILYEDRDLFVSVQKDLNRIREVMITADRRNELLFRDTNKAIETQGKEVKMKTDEVKEEVLIEVDEVKAKTDQVRNSVPKTVVNGIKKAFDAKSTKLQKKSFGRRLANVLTLGIIK